MKRRRPFWLWALALWMLALAVISASRGLVLWSKRSLLAELESVLSSPALAVFVALFVLCGLGLGTSALGLWWRRDWGRSSARACIPLYFVIIQAYTWLFARSGLMWERRRISLILAICAVVIGVGALSWHRSRRWLGLR